MDDAAEKESDWSDDNSTSAKKCAVPFEFLVGRQTSRESGEIPPDRRPVRVCMVDYLKLEAVNREEVYLRRTF